ncbi:unnamed protein product [Linum trigynum]|uniref:Uncharacterized protein n=1 Tax=Linum trigynum TaxID=586398 RepID=A0AAV2DMF7_9ROSI
MSFVTNHRKKTTRAEGGRCLGLDGNDYRCRGPFSSIDGLPAPSPPTSSLSLIDNRAHKKLDIAAINSDLVRRKQISGNERGSLERELKGGGFIAATV